MTNDFYIHEVALNKETDMLRVVIWTKDGIEETHYFPRSKLYECGFCENAPAVDMVHDTVTGQRVDVCSSCAITYRVHQQKMNQ